MFWWPRRENDSSGRLQHAAHLADGDLWTRREHMAELTDHDVEAAVRIGEVLGITLLPLDLRLPCDSAILASFQ